MPAHLIDEWPVWRLVNARLATLREIDEHWTLADVADANDVLDLQQAADVQAATKE